MFGIKRYLTLAKKDQMILDQARKNKETIYGSQSIKKHLGVFSREPGDWDILTNTPQRSSKMIEQRLDRSSGGNNYYTKKSDYHKGTYKVREIGLDNKKNTDDDILIADYSKPSRKYETQKIGGIRYVTLRETVKDKNRSIQDPNYEYRKDKDLEDLRYSTKQERTKKQSMAAKA